MLPYHISYNQIHTLSLSQLCPATIREFHQSCSRGLLVLQEVFYKCLYNKKYYIINSKYYMKYYINFYLLISFFTKYTPEEKKKPVYSIIFILSTLAVVVVFQCYASIGTSSCSPINYHWHNGNIFPCH